VGRAATDLRELKEKLCPGSAILVGYSLGAFIILEYIDKYGLDEIEKIVLTDISPKFISEGEWKFGLYGGEYTRTDFDRHMRGIESEFYPGVAYFVYRNVRKGGQGRRFRDSAPLWAHVIARIRIRNKPEKRAAVFFYFKSLCESDHRSTLARLDVDTAIFYADPGSLFLPETAEYMAGRVPGGAALVPFTGASHIQILRPAGRFARRLLRFIRNGI
jgi:pimeloyl-ACP methyl ester carboxylesterase